MKNNVIEDVEIKLSKDQLLYLESRVKKLMDDGNYKLAYIMARNISNYLNENNKKTKIKRKW